MSFLQVEFSATAHADTDRRLSCSERRLDFPFDARYAVGGSASRPRGKTNAVQKTPCVESAEMGSERQGDAMTMHDPYGDDYGQDETANLARSLTLSSARL